VNLPGMTIRVDADELQRLKLAVAMLTENLPDLERSVGLKESVLTLAVTPWRSARLWMEAAVCARKTRGHILMNVSEFIPIGDELIAVHRLLGELLKAGGRELPG
jgi:hypothetical protein